MIEYGRLIVQLPIPMVILGKNESFPQKVVVWLGVCSKGVYSFMIFEDGTMNHDRYIKEVLPVTVKFGNDTPAKQYKDTHSCKITGMMC